MDDLLNAVSTTRTVQKNIDKFESLSLNNSNNNNSTGRPGSSKSTKKSILDLTPCTNEPTNPPVEMNPSFDMKPSADEALPSKAPDAVQKKAKHYDSTPFLQQSYLTTPADALPADACEILRKQPDADDLLAVLQYLQYGLEGKHAFCVHVASPQASQIIAAIVTKVVPDHWHIYQQADLATREKQSRDCIVRILRSVPGIGALLLQLKEPSADGPAKKPILLDTASVLAMVLKPSSTLRTLLEDTRKLYGTQAMRHAVWQEVVALLAGSKVLSSASEAVQSMSLELAANDVFVADGAQYSQWLARNVSMVAANLFPPDSEAWNMLSKIGKRGLNLGYRDAFVSELYSGLIFGSRALWTPLRQLLKTFSAAEQRSFFDAMLRDLTRKYLRPGIGAVESATAATDHAANGLESDKAIGGVAAMVLGLVEGNRVLDEHLVEWLTSSSGEYANLGLDTRRAVIATLATRKERLQKILNKCLDKFGDKAQMQQEPMLQQETTAATILIVVGYLYRLDRGSVKDLAQQGAFLRTTSNRLGASVPRARLLGLIVATAISRLVDAEDKRLDFGLEELAEDDAQKWFSLVNVQDAVGTIESLGGQADRPEPAAEAEAEERVRAKAKEKAKTKAARQGKGTKARRQPVPYQKIVSIEEITDDDDAAAAADADADLVPYAKPDSDASDSEEDATLIERTKASAPIYIVDLIAQLSASDKPDMVALALGTAPGLIRRKAHFGSELSENVTALASALVNLRECAHDQRLDALLACLVACPRIIGPWAAALYFDGDLALDQRASLLSMLGLGARELSGYETSSSLLEREEDNFPGKRLPGHLAALYAGPSERLANEMAHATIQPLALAAADKATGPDVLKVRTFSSRMAVEQKRAARQEARSRRIPKDVHALLTTSIYLPLCCRLGMVFASAGAALHDGGGGGGGNIFDATIVRLFLHTLAIVLVCLGPHAAALADTTRETLVLLTALHNTAPRLAGDPAVLPALLQLLLAVLDLNVAAGAVAEQRLVMEFGGMMAALVHWSAGLELPPAPSGDEDDGPAAAGVLVAALQVKWHEVGQRHQGRMIELMGLVGPDGMEF